MIDIAKITGPYRAFTLRALLRVAEMRRDMCVTMQADGAGGIERWKQLVHDQTVAAYWAGRYQSALDAQAEPMNCKCVPVPIDNSPGESAK